MIKYAFLFFLTCSNLVFPDTIQKVIHPMNLNLSIGYLNSLFYKEKINSISSISISGSFRTKASKYAYFITATIGFPMDYYFGSGRMSVFNNYYSLVYYLDTGVVFYLLDTKKITHDIELGIGLNQSSLYLMSTVQLGVVASYNLTFNLNKFFSFIFKPSVYYGFIDLLDVKYENYKFGLRFGLDIGFKINFISLSDSDL